MIPRHLLWWWLGLRWLAVLTVFATVYFAVEVSGLVPASAAPRLWILTGALATFNALLIVAGPLRIGTARWVLGQIAADVVFLAAAIHGAGGLANPFASLFVVHTMIAALLLPRSAALLAGAAIAAVVLGLTVVETTGALPPGCLLEAAGSCKVAEAPQLAAWGLTASALSLGCALVVARLIAEVRSSQAEAEHRAIGLSQARAELLIVQEKLRSIVQCMADAVIVASPSGEVILHNHAAATLWTARPPAAQASPDLRVCHTPEKWNEVLARVRDSGPHEDHPLLHLGDRAFDASYARVRGPDGDLLGVVMVARDVTERLAEQHRRVDAERMATIGRLAAALAHELNNPLSAIALFTQHALKSVDPAAPLGQHLATVKRNADSCKKIVSDLLTYSRQRAPERCRVDHAELLGDVVRTLEPQCRRSAIQVEIAAAGAPPIWADPDQLRQALVNLGLNAIDAMPDGGVLRFVVEPEGERGVRIAVTDSGTGIAAEERERIFAAFYTTKAQGTGLGLAVVRDLMAAHGGHVDVDSDVGRGSTFSLHLPAIAPPQPGAA